MLIFFVFDFFSAWISKENVNNYSEYKERFVHKNKTIHFRNAITEIENEMSLESSNPLTLKNYSTDDIVATFDENVSLIKCLYDSHLNTLDRLIDGNGMDYLTVLFRIVTTAQQHKMHSRILQNFTKSEKAYMENPNVSIFISLILFRCFDFIDLILISFSVARKPFLDNFNSGMGSFNLYAETFTY